MSIEVMKQALAKFESLWEIGIDAVYRVELLPEIQALRQAIEQTETQKPVAYRLNVAGIWHFIDAEHAQRIPEECEPLYTALELK